ncbi:MAG: anthranilate phosphoribosyltransferase [Thermodesulfobacteriota bacterium]|nr:anthranilate phosphoribosyltransferase [Thermodesulfobacteriota bacterium]
MNTLKKAISDVVSRKDLSQAEISSVMEIIMEGEATPAQIGALLTGLRMKGETVDEIAGAAKVMREKAVRIHVNLSRGESLVDTCGTGGDGAQTFNVSTTAAFVVAGAGVKVAKHGNRSVSSRSGSADVLEALGVNLALSPEDVARAVETIGMGFMFAPALHPAMKYAIGPRREIGIRTIFNVLGPLTNPAWANVQVLGVYDPVLTRPLAEVLGRLGSKRAWVVHGEGGLDELSLLGKSVVAQWDKNEVKEFVIRPEDAGLKPCKAEDLKGGDAEENAEILKGILSGKTGPKRDMVLLNAGAAIFLADRAKSLREGVVLAAESIDSMEAMKKLEALKAFSMR